MVKTFWMPFSQVFAAILFGCPIFKLFLKGGQRIYFKTSRSFLFLPCLSGKSVKKPVLLVHSLLPGPLLLPLPPVGCRILVCADLPGWDDYTFVLA